MAIGSDFLAAAFDDFVAGVGVGVHVEGAEDEFVEVGSGCKRLADRLKRFIQLTSKAYGAIL